MLLGLLEQDARADGRLGPVRLVHDVLELLELAVVADGDVAKMLLQHLIALFKHSLVEPVRREHGYVLSRFRANIDEACGSPLLILRALDGQVSGKVDLGSVQLLVRVLVYELHHGLATSLFCRVKIVCGRRLFVESLV